MYKLVFFVPKAHCESVKEAVFRAGAGKQGDYENCCWQVLGQGQFLPVGDSQPFIGKKGTLETVAEYRVEMICGDHCIQQVVSALKEAHPYEEPAYDIWPLADF